MISSDTVEHSPVMPGGKRYDFFIGVTELSGGKFTMLLDMQEILNSLDEIQMAQIQETIRQSYMPELVSSEDQAAMDEEDEWEEVYDNRYYGTLKSEVNRIRQKGLHVVFDVDVVGGFNIKKMYKDDALAIFVKPPDIKTLEERLRTRDTDNEDEIRTRVSKAEYEMTFADQFDVIIVNDDLEKAKQDTLKNVKEFIEN